MGLDYYAIIDVPRDASISDIKLSYRKLALRLHPNRKRYPQHPNPRPEGTFESHLPTLPKNTCWELLNEAYDVLSDDLRRQVYDCYGEEGLKRGVTAPDGEIAAYCYHKEPLRTYFEFFGSFSPYADLVDAVVNPPPLYHVKEGVGVKNKDPTIKQLLPLDLEEVFHGGVKTVKILRQQFVDEFKTKTEATEVEISVPIAAGILGGTCFSFLEAGDQGPTRIPADVHVFTCDKPHKVFRRDKWNLHCDHEISLKESLTGFKMTVDTIDERKINIFITDVVDCKFVKEIPDEGLPILNESPKKGSLFVHFKVIFPKFIPKHLRSKLEEVFKEINEIENHDSSNHGCCRELNEI